ncbi:MAG: AMP-binding protein [Proteobacteria bacterium]|nr:AMP-binding protein [Pseudomonadota bacterium]
MSIYHERPWLKFYPSGVPAEVEVPIKSLPQAFDEAAAKWKKKTALVFYGRKISYTELKDHVDRLARALADLGIRKGDTVAILMLNSPQYFIAYYGALKAGARLTLVSPMYVSSEVRHQLEDSEARHIICQNILYDFVEKSGVPLKTVILTDIGEYLPRWKRFLGKSVLGAVYQKMALPSPRIFQQEGVYHLQDLIKKYPPDPPAIEWDPREDVATLQYTGGTTSLPKAAVLTHYNYIANEAQMFCFIRNRVTEGQEVMAAYMPFYHAAGQLNITQGIIRGFTMVISATTDLEDLLNDIEDFKVTMFVGAPTIFEFLKDYEKTYIVDWKRMKYVLAGADALLQDTAQGFERRTGIKICEGYGMSEAVAGTHSNPLDRIKPGSFGVPLPSTMAAILAPEKDEYLGIGEIGEIAVQGPSVMKGYWKADRANREKFCRIEDDVWMRTGDLGRMDEEGYFFFYDRLRDMIKYKGHAVFATEVEDVIKDHPGVKEVGVVGVRDPVAGELVKAVVVLEGDARGKISEEDIQAYCRDKLAAFKIPKIVAFRGEIPKTDVGKVSRRELREDF